MILRQSQTNASGRAIRQTLKPLWAVVVAAALSFAASGATQGETAPPYTNRLVHSADPYLLLHAHNPVDWYPWGPEAFAKAKAENKPIFISIGYSSCYWCHVAEKEIYSDPDTAALMNKWFVNVKVDREERPDVDRFYILATEILTEHGAWPNNLFLTPDGRPFYAGSYFPPRDGGGETPGFPRLLAAIHDLWDHKRSDQVEPAANNVMAALREIEAKRSTAASVPVTPAAWLATGATSLLRSVDPEHGGFGNPQTGPKFPQAPALALLAAAATPDNNAPANAALQNTLAAMAFGGVRDQLAGGFHRYATEPTWSLPHFEKMLSDNAQLLAIYTAAFARTGNALDRAIALDTARYLMRDMALAEGGFATAQDAETKGVEGATYLWTRAEIEAVLGAADTETFLAIYELTPLPDAPRGAAVSLEALGQPGVLRVRLPITATLQRANVADAAAMFAALAPLRDKLLAACSNRTQPLRDDKIVTDLNGLAIGALAKAGAVLKEPAFIDTATKAAARIWSLAYDAKDGKLKHQIFEGRAAVDGFLDDYAALGDGLLTLAEVTHVSLWHDRATVLGDATVSRFLRADGGLSTGDGERLLPVAVSDGEDADTPSGTSNALRLLARLGADGGERFAQAAARVSTHLASALAAQPTVWPSAVVTLAEYPPIAKPQVAAAAAGPPPSSDVPSSAQHVHASAVLLADPGGDAVAVTLKIDPGFHVNGHAPNLDYLVPSVVSFDAAAPSRIDYPEPSLFKPSFAKNPLLVYEGTAKIIAHFDGGLPRGGGALTARISVQACDARTCLPPTELLAPVRPAEMPSASR